MFAGSLIVSLDEPNPIGWFLYIFPFNTAIYFLPVWGVRWYLKNYDKYFINRPE